MRYGLGVYIEPSKWIWTLLSRHRGNIIIHSFGESSTFSPSIQKTILTFTLAKSCLIQDEMIFIACLQEYELHQTIKHKMSQLKITYFDYEVQCDFDKNQTRVKICFLSPEIIDLISSIAREYKLPISAIERQQDSLKRLASLKYYHPECVGAALRGIYGQF